MRFSTAGIVLRDFKYEDNRILTILTEELGVLTAFANHANRPRSKFAGSTELLCYSDFVLYKGRSGYSVNEADSIKIFFGIRSRIEDLSLASYFAQIFSELAPKEENAKSQMELLLGCLHYLELQSRPVKQLKAIAELRLLTLSGYMPDLVGCKVCGEYTANTMYFTKTGELICGDCLSQEDSTEIIKLTPGVLAAMRHIVYSQPRKVFAFKLSPKGLNLLARVSEGYLIYQLEKIPPALNFYKSMSN